MQALYIANAREICIISMNINYKNDKSHGHEGSCYPKESLLVVCKFFITCMDIHRASNSLFLI